MSKTRPSTSISRSSPRYLPDLSWPYHQDDEEVFFKIKKQTQFRKLMDAYCQRQGVSFHHCNPYFTHPGLFSERKVPVRWRENHEGADPHSARNGEWGRDRCGDRADRRVLKMGNEEVNIHQKDICLYMMMINSNIHEFYDFQYWKVRRTYIRKMHQAPREEVLLIMMKGWSKKSLILKNFNISFSDR